MPIRETKTVLKNVISRLQNWKSRPALISRKLELEQRLLSPEERVKRAQAAQELLSNSLLREVVGAEEANIIDQMKRCNISDKEMHTRLVMALQISGAVHRHLWARIQDGSHAMEDINLRGSRID